MARTTSADVKALVETAKGNLGSFIDDASAIVDDELTGSGLSEARLKTIEKYLAAHYVALTEDGERASSFGAGDTNATFGSLDKGFDQTRFGQQAMALDTTGNLKAMSSGRRATMTIGKHALDD